MSSWSAHLVLSGLITEAILKLVLVLTLYDGGKINTKFHTCPSLPSKYYVFLVHCVVVYTIM